MLKKLIILLLVAAPFGAFAQDKIAYINTDEVFAQLPELKDVESKLAAKQEEIKKNAAAMEAEYQNKLDEWSKDTTTVTESIALDRQKQLQQIQERYETYLQNSNKEMTDLRQQLLAPLQQKFQKAVQDVGSELGYTYIIEGGVMLYTSPSAANVNNQVKAKLGIK
ncbi:MAG: OmpH family outer membrane protein [Dysgonomonas sp.]